MKTSSKEWDSLFAKLKLTGIRYPTTSWLEEYLPELRQKNVRKVLELGCGSGADTVFLVSKGFEVTSTDFSIVALDLVKSNAPDAEIVLHDLRDPFPFKDQTFDLVIANLSLHYFDFPTTREIIHEIARVLRGSGFLLYRVNSTSDSTEKSVQVDRYYYTKDLCRKTFLEWNELRLIEKTIDYYGHEKVLWEGFLEKPQLRQKIVL
jgi:SAM-dependent methyltransferase